MAIQLPLQRRNFGIPFNSAADFHHLIQPGDNHGQSIDLIQQSRSQSGPDHGASFMAEMSTDQIDRFIQVQVSTSIYDFLEREWRYVCGFFKSLVSFLQQSERFRLLLQYRRNQQFGVLLNQIETRTRFLFQQKDEEIACANKKRIYLEQLFTKLQMENQEQQRAVQENQAMVVSLSQALDQIRDRHSSCPNDAESNNNVNNRSGEDHDAIDCGKNRMICRICNSRISCMLFLPCRHLCSCKPCENALDFCPVCNTTKKASIEAVIF